VRRLHQQAQRARPGTRKQATATGSAWSCSFQQTTAGTRSATRPALGLPESSAIAGGIRAGENDAPPPRKRWINRSQPGQLLSPARCSARQHRPRRRRFRLIQKSVWPGTSGGYASSRPSHQRTGMGCVPQQQGPPAVKQRIGSGASSSAWISQTPAVEDQPPRVAAEHSAQSTGHWRRRGLRTFGPPVDRPWRGPAEPGAADGSNVHKMDRVC